MSSLVNKRNRALKMMLWFGIGSLFMTFAGLTSAFIVSKNREDWVQNFDLPEAFYYSLIFILSSSIILIFARRLLIKNQQKNSKFQLFQNRSRIDPRGPRGSRGAPQSSPGAENIEKSDFMKKFENEF